MRNFFSIMVFARLHQLCVLNDSHNGLAVLVMRRGGRNEIFVHGSIGWDSTPVPQDVCSRYISNLYRASVNSATEKWIWKQPFEAVGCAANGQASTFIEVLKLHIFQLSVYDDDQDAKLSRARFLCNGSVEPLRKQREKTRVSWWWARSLRYAYVSMEC